MGIDPTSEYAYLSQALVTVLLGVMALVIAYRDFQEKKAARTGKNKTGNQAASPESTASSKERISSAASPAVKEGAKGTTTTTEKSKN